MDELASSGLYFSNAFVTAPICAASRATLFTGLYERMQPESEQGKTLRDMVLNVDITPTILKLAGVDIPESYQGESLIVFYRNTP